MHDAHRFKEKGGKYDSAETAADLKLKGSEK